MEGLEEGLHRLGKGARAQDVQGVCGLYGGFTKQTLYQIIEDTCDKYNNMREDQIKDITEAIEKCVAACAEETRKLIDECQPAKFF